MISLSQRQLSGRVSPKPPNPAFKFVRVYSAFLVIGFAFIWSAFTIFSTRVEEAPPGVTTIRMAHWQLEIGCRTAIDELAKDYQKEHPNVRIVQEIIPDGVYGTWVTTNLLAGTAPDLLEIPEYRLPDDIVTQYYSRYFVPLTQYVSQPNPYNKGTDLEGKPLRKTFKDGLNHAYIKELQEYMHLPLSMFNVRIFYNKDLYKKLTGRSDDPKDYRDFIEICKTIASHKMDRGQSYIPICAASDSMWAWDSMLFDPITYSALRKIDFDRDGTCQPEETYVGFRTKMADFNFPAFKARFEMTREVTRYFPIGHTGLARDDAVFQFAQQRGVFFSTGTWDAESLIHQADGKFEVGVMDFPMPSPDDPQYGKFIEGPRYEEVSGGFPMGIPRSSKNKEAALDFLLFMTAQKQNQKLNNIMKWIPVVYGTKTEKFLEAFDPHLEGIYTAMVFKLGPETRNRFEQLYSLLTAEKITAEEFQKEYGPFFVESGRKDWDEKQRTWRRGILDSEQAAAPMRAKAFTTENSSSDWIKYRAFFGVRLIKPEIELWRKAKLVNEKFGPDAVGPYEYSREVLERIRARLKNSSKTQSKN